MNTKDKEQYKKILLAEKQQLTQQLSEFHSISRTEESPMAQDVGDRAESSYTKEFLLSLSDTERKRLNMVDEALRRIEGGEFGNCLTCGKEILKKRLNAIPWARNCISCQKAEEESS